MFGENSTSLFLLLLTCTGDLKSAVVSSYKTKCSVVFFDWPDGSGFGICLASFFRIFPVNQVGCLLVRQAYNVIWASIVWCSIDSSVQVCCMHDQQHEANWGCHFIHDFQSAESFHLKLWGGTSQRTAASVDALEAGGTACISLTTVGSSSLKNVYIGQNYSRKNGLNVFSFITWFAWGGEKIRWLMEATWCKKMQGAFLFLLFFPVSGRVDERFEYLDLESYKSWPPRNFDMFDYVASRLC